MIRNPNRLALPLLRVQLITLDDLLGRQVALRRHPHDGVLVEVVAPVLQLVRRLGVGFAELADVVDGVGRGDFVATVVVGGLCWTSVRAWWEGCPAL